jgi:endonuclease YncB( thermonuclease family)
MVRGARKFAVLAALIVTAGCADKESGTAAQAPQPKYETISGIAIAEDGDTVIINDRRIDLWGVEAPNLDNADGWYSRAALDDFIGENGQLVCIVKVKRQRARDQAICSNNRVGDLGRALLQNGWAVVARRDKRDQQVDTALAGVYYRTELRARTARVGHWSKYPAK